MQRKRCRSRRGPPDEYVNAGDESDLGGGGGVGNSDASGDDINCDHPGSSKHRNWQVDARCRATVLFHGGEGIAYFLARLARLKVAVVVTFAD